MKIMKISLTPRCASHRKVEIRGVHHTAESGVPTFSKNSAVCIPLRREALRCASYHGVKLRSVLHTGDSSSAVCCTPGSQAPRCAAHRGVKLCSVHHTAVSNCTPRSQNQNLRESLVAFKGTIRCAAHRGVKFFELCDRIPWRNRNRKYFSLSIRGPDGFES